LIVSEAINRPTIGKDTHTMSKNNVVELKKPDVFVNDPITELVRNGAREILAKALEAFWIGDRWQNDRYYLSISDFKYTHISEGQLNTEPDDDWGYDAPYFFQVRLIYHPGDSEPD
jgi:hypothetical protein